MHGNALVPAPPRSVLAGGIDGRCGIGAFLLHFARNAYARRSEMTHRPLLSLSRRAHRLLAAAIVAAGPGVASAAPDSAQEQVVAAERAFAKSMADRSLASFAGFVSEEAVFFGKPAVLRGKAQVVAGWSRFFEPVLPPFSWEPDQVEVLDSGTLALSTGPVRDRAGTVIGRFNSVWRLEAPGVWRVVFDKGSPPEPADGQSRASAPGAPSGTPMQEVR